MDLLSEGDLKYLVDHIFLPLKLPQKYDTDTLRRDNVLLNYVASTSGTFQKICRLAIVENLSNSVAAWNIISRMLDNMGTFYDLDNGGIVRSKLQAALERMKISGRSHTILNTSETLSDFSHLDVIPVFVEAQNAAIIFRKIAADILTFETFEVSLPCDVVMKAQGKISVRFPTNPPLPLPASAVVIPTLATVLAHLSTNLMDEAAPVSRKGGANHYEVRDTASPRFITEGLAGIIRATPPSVHVAFDTTYIQKRIDDHVLWKSALKPWRRSSMWLVIRVAMQSTLKQWGVEGAQGYKAFQAVLMASILDKVTSSNSDEFSYELISVMNAKLARRLWKMGDILENPTSLSLNMASDAVRRASGAIKERWQAIRQRHERTVQWTPPPLPLEPDDVLKYSFPHSQGFLRSLIEWHDNAKWGSVTFDCEAFEMQLGQTTPPRASLSSSQLPTITSSHDVGMTLYDVEVWVELHLEPWKLSPLRSEQDCLSLSLMIEAYRKLGCSHYKGDPERVSLMHLCILELWAALDHICVKWCSLLQRYIPEIPQNVTDPLLLPHGSQMKRLARLQSYLDSRYQIALKYGGHSIFRHPNAKTSFPNQYFKLPEAEALTTLERTIRADESRRKEEKLSELQRCTTQYNDLMSQADPLTCSKTTKINKKGVQIVSHKRKHCEKCRLMRQAKGLRVIPIEDPLPEDIFCARPIIFELTCPLPFAVWRDTTFDIILSITGGPSCPQVELYPLREYAPLKQYFSEAYKDGRIHFASKAKALERSHYGRGCRMPATSSQIIFKHMGSFDIFDAASSSWVDTSGESILQAACTFQIEGLYAPLQAFVNDTRHTPNSVLASHTNSPVGVSSMEYITFGLLRAGNRLQWRNIMKAIRTQALPFSDPGVLVLVLQSIWQVGPVGDDELEIFYRDAHIDLLDVHFGTEVTEELQCAVNSLGNNWKQTKFLAILVALGLRVMSLTPHTSVRLRAQQLLCQVRKLAMEWIKILLGRQTESTDQGSTHGQGKVSDHGSQIIVNIAVILQASFDGGIDGDAKLFQSKGDVVAYIYARTLTSTAQTHSFLPGLRILASRNHRLALKLEAHVIRACIETPSILQDVLALAYPRYATGYGWTPLSAYHGRWWKSILAESGTPFVRSFHMNITDGTLLIDGKAFDQLPANYIEQPLYLDLFRDHVRFFFL